MKEIKLLFVEAEKADHAALASLFNSIPQTDYYFIIMPPRDTVMTRKQVIELLTGILKD